MRRTRFTTGVLMMASAATAFAGERAIEAEITVDAPRGEVWKAWTSTEGVTTFFAPNAHVELRSGGPFEIYFVPDAKPGSRGSEGCKVLGYVPEEMLMFSWNAPPKFVEMRGKRTFVVLRLSDADGGGTRVQLTNGGYGEGEKWNEIHDYFSKAWPHVLANLKKRFESGPLWPDDQRMQVAAPETKVYTYFIRPVRAGLFIDHGTDEEKAAIGKHAEYLRQLLAENRLEFAGPCTDDAQYPDESAGLIPFTMDRLGIVVFRAENDEQAKATMESDPAVQAGVFKACVNPFALVFQRP